MILLLALIIGVTGLVEERRDDIGQNLVVKGATDNRYIEYVTLAKIKSIFVQQVPAPDLHAVQLGAVQER